MQDYRTDYKIRTWANLPELERLLNQMVADGWRIENHKLSAGSEESGWTIFAKVTMLRKPLLERNINVGRVYTILNRVLDPGTEQSRDFDRQIKSAVKLEGDE